ncbi:hypothetical protein PHLCEN_2v6106 [Hermanssonia centrifuga]|uniref:Uncharacterized protein n=1 Tax=Hermanssonia centrifuga TaxID=98765 RepID=A0A2R6P0D6_9APHY|nr:hypothetical protein PHLCEN_2v6106 [Hermanssonia centrifuga]
MSSPPPSPPTLPTVDIQMSSSPPPILLALNIQMPSPPPPILPAVATNCCTSKEKPIPKFILDMTKRNLKRLHHPGSYLNDNMISCGLSLLQAHNGYLHIARWTSKVDIFSKKYLLIPIHDNMKYVHVLNAAWLLSDYAQ